MSADLPPDPQGELLRRRRNVLGGAYRLFYREPFAPVRGDGVWLYDAAGRRYLDAYNNVPCVGHAHPRVVQAMAQQASTLNTHTRYLTDGIVDYAERLLALFPAHLDRLMLTCTGSEANDLACRVATHATGGTGFIVTANAYHGVTSAVAALSPSLGLPPAEHVRTVRAPDPAATPGVDHTARLVQDVRAAVADLQRHGIRTAALVVDTIASSDGVQPGPAGAWAAAAQEVRRHGGLFVADEVQAGFARVGEAFWGFAHHDAHPDLVTLGKPMGNGYPMGGVVLGSALADDFGAAARYFNTFGGNPVACAVGTAVLDVLADEDLPAQVEDVGRYLRASLRELAGGQPVLGDVRGAGLFTGVDVLDPSTGTLDTAGATALVEELRERAVLVSATGPAAATLKVRPPLVFTRGHADLLVSTLGEVLGEVLGELT